MRPVHRDTSPIEGDFSEYREALNDLVSRLGFYCSYCERHIHTQLAVEHIQPKDLYAGLIGRWDNFLLGCVNCNSTKLNKDVSLDRYFMPDRDNTLAAFDYTLDGRIQPKTTLGPAQQQMAIDTLALTGLDKRLSQTKDENGRLVAIDRVSQRMEAILIAQRASGRLAAQPTDEMREQIVETALAQGFFSIWMMVFEQDAAMRRRFLEAFPGTAQDCFDANTHLISPRPNNGLSYAGKV